MLSGAFCLVMLTNDALYAVRDPLGIRPLCLGRLDGGGWVVASESCALDTIGAQLIREVEPGELLGIDARRRPHRALRDAPRRWPAASGRRAVSLPMAGFPQRAACSFEFIYFARPDSVIDGQLVYAARERMGQILAREHPVEADFVIAVPDSAIAGRHRLRRRVRAAVSARGWSRTATSGGRSSSPTRASASGVSP